MLREGLSHFLCIFAAIINVQEMVNRLIKGYHGFRETTLLLFWLLTMPCLAQNVEPRQEKGFMLRKESDSLYFLNDWRLPYPVYQFQTGDVDGDGSVDAMVGVIKSTRFYPEKGRRLFIFKQVNGKARPLWLGSKLGGILEDFRYIDRKIRALESTTDSLYVVSEYRWSGFGMNFDHYIIKGVDQKTALKYFNQ
jgi:hypothetical protein